MQVHIDGDVIGYRAGYAAEHTFYHVHYREGGKQATKVFDGANEYRAFLKEHPDWTPLDYLVETEVVVEDESAAIYNVRSIINAICDDLQVDRDTEVLVYLSGPDNYRNGVATIKPYKGNRDPAREPVHAPANKEYIRRTYNCITSDGQEADDDMAIAHYAMWEVDPASSVIATIDKDLDMIPGLHYNFVTKESYNVTPEEGTFNFYKQLLTGDSVDNIPGLQGVGPVGAGKILAGSPSLGELDLWRTVSRAYADRHPEDWPARILEVGRLLWIRRRPDEWWNPPEEVVHDGVSSGDSEPSVRVPEGVPAEERGL